MMYQVEVCRTAYGFRTLEIEANNEQEAEQKALDTAGNFEFSEKSSDYTVEFVSTTD